jgi:hypothetical protein
MLLVLNHKIIFASKIIEDIQQYPYLITCNNSRKIQ